MSALFAYAALCFSLASLCFAIVYVVTSYAAPSLSRLARAIANASLISAVVALLFVFLPMLGDY